MCLRTPCCAVLVADSLIGIFYGDFYELTLLESQRASISSAAACMQKKCPWSLCLPTKSDLLLSYAARLKLSYPATPSSVPLSELPTNTPRCTHTHTQNPHPHPPPILEAFILSLILSLLFARICSKLSRLRAFYVNLVAQKAKPWLQAKSASFKKKGRKKRDTSKRIV